MAQRGAPKSSKKPARPKAARKHSTGPIETEARSASAAGAGSRDAGGSGKTVNQAAKAKASARAKPVLATPAQDTPAQDTPAQVTPVQVTPAQATPAQATPARGTKELTFECARLRVELEQARDEIKVLKGRQDFVLNRIDWAIDSLHNLLEEDQS